MNLIITGGSNGIGKAIYKLAKQTYTVFNYDLENNYDIRKTIKVIEKIDVLINNAGITDIGSIRDKDIIKKTKIIMETNLYGTMRIIQEVLKKMKKGSIINIGSKMAFYPSANRLAYSVSKGAIVSLSKQLAVELAPDIRVNCISPGTIDTQMPKSEVRKIRIYNNLLNRKGKPEEVAKFILDVAENEYITGQNYYIDGGLL